MKAPRPLPGLKKQLMKAILKDRFDVASRAALGDLLAERGDLKGCQIQRAIIRLIQSGQKEKFDFYRNSFRRKQSWNQRTRRFEDV